VNPTFDLQHRRSRWACMDRCRKKDGPSAYSNLFASVELREGD
jgi:hypothetical protein